GKRIPLSDKCAEPARDSRQLLKARGVRHGSIHYHYNSRVERFRYLLRAVWIVAVLCSAIPDARSAPPPGATILRPARVLDGETSHEGWAVRVKGERIEEVGPTSSITAGDAKVIELAGATLLPGLVEGHSHMLLHPYNETTWNDQVLHESLGLRV